MQSFLKKIKPILAFLSIWIRSRWQNAVGKRLYLPCGTTSDAYLSWTGRSAPVWAPSAPVAEGWRPHRGRSPAGVRGWTAPPGRADGGARWAGWALGFLKLRTCRSPRWPLGVAKGRVLSLVLGGSSHFRNWMYGNGVKWGGRRGASGEKSTRSVKWTRQLKTTRIFYRINSLNRSYDKNKWRFWLPTRTAYPLHATTR